MSASLKKALNRISVFRIQFLCKLGQFLHIQSHIFLLMSENVRICLSCTDMCPSSLLSYFIFCKNNTEILF